jgi:hypothetical protein
MTNENVGKIIGIYEIVSVCDERDTDGHLLYHVKCTQCSYENDMRLYDIKQATRCAHKCRNGRIIDFKLRWKNKRLRSIFESMIRRCYNNEDKSYKWYGEKGIKICDEWLDNPKLFEEWALNTGYQNGLTIDRIDSDKNYCPENCRWITLEENSRRAGKVNWITVNGETLTGKQWAAKLEIGVNTINKFISKYGAEKTIQLIDAMLKNPSLKQQKNNCKSWFSIYDIAV